MHRNRGFVYVCVWVCVRVCVCVGGGDGGDGELKDCRYSLTLQQNSVSKQHTVNWKIFVLKIFCKKKFRVKKIHSIWVG